MEAVLRVFTEDRAAKVWRLTCQRAGEAVFGFRTPAAMGMTGPWRPRGCTARRHMGSAGAAQVFGDSSSGKQQPARAPASAETPQLNKNLPTRRCASEAPPCAGAPDIPAPGAAPLLELQGFET